jgi:hypothetical protein
VAVRRESARVRLHFRETRDAATKGPTLVDVSAALYDFALVYDVAVLTTLPEYESYDFGTFFYVGRNRPTRRGHQLRLKQLSYESPFLFLGDIPTVVAVAGAVWPLAKAMEVVYTLGPRLRVAKKRKLLEETRLDRALADERAQAALAQLRERQASQRLELSDAEIDVGSHGPGGEPNA